MTTTATTPEDDVKQYGKVLAVLSDRKMQVATDAGPIINWVDDGFNTKKIDGPDT